MANAGRQPIAQHSDTDDDERKMMNGSAASADIEIETEIDDQWKWKSAIFVVERDKEDDDGIELSEYFDTDITKKTRKIVYPIYILIALAALVMVFMGLFGDDVIALISILSICTMTWVGSIVGMIGVYVWGTVEDCVDWFRAQNSKFDHNIENLKNVRSKVKEVAKNVYANVSKLQHHSKELTKHLESFEELRSSLQEICGKNEELSQVLDQINAQYKDLVTVISQNERASLLSIYYEVSILDHDEGLSKKEYQKFLGRLNNKTKELFLEIGEFEALDLDQSGTLELDEFERILDMVIEKQENLNIQHYMKDTTND